VLIFQAIQITTSIPTMASNNNNQFQQLTKDQLIKLVIKQQKKIKSQGSIQGAKTKQIKKLQLEEARLKQSNKQLREELQQIRATGFNRDPVIQDLHKKLKQYVKELEIKDQYTSKFAREAKQAKQELQDLQIANGVQPTKSGLILKQQQETIKKLQKETFQKQCVINNQLREIGRLMRLQQQQVPVAEPVLAEPVLAIVNNFPQQIRDLRQENSNLKLELQQFNKVVQDKAKEFQEYQEAQVVLKKELVKTLKAQIQEAQKEAQQQKANSELFQHQYKKLADTHHNQLLIKDQQIQLLKKDLEVYNSL
jgi:myosin heavy subunit